MFKTTRLTEESNNQLGSFQVILIFLIHYQAFSFYCFSKYFLNMYPKFSKSTFSSNLVQNVSSAQSNTKHLLRKD